MYLMTSSLMMYTYVISAVANLHLGVYLSRNKEERVGYILTLLPPEVTEDLSNYILTLLPPSKGDLGGSKAKSEDML